MFSNHEILASKSSFSRDELLQLTESGFRGERGALLPKPPLLMIDRISKISLNGGKHSAGHVLGELDVQLDSWFFHGHFLNDPLMPGCLGLGAMWQLVCFWCGWSGMPGKIRPLAVGEVKFAGSVRPDACQVQYAIDMRQRKHSMADHALADGYALVAGNLVFTALGIRVSNL